VAGGTFLAGDVRFAGGLLPWRMEAGGDKDTRHSMASDLPKRTNKCTNRAAALC
jgi:hypothetical protein